ncbi:MAG: sugar kinase [Marinilabiliales bacterium]|nr:MAG: sugar kinase [Marinilabiliales bacterium]
MELLVVGTVAFDAIETPFGKTDRIIGGAATYIGLAASYFTREIGIISAVGGDFPDEYIKMLNEHGVDTGGLEIRENEKSFYWSGRYDTDMNSRETLFTRLNVIENYKPVVPKSYQGSDILMLGNLEPGIQMSVIEQMKTRPRLIVLDTMNFWIEHTPAYLNKVIRMVDVLVINDSEARELSGEYSLPKAAKRILRMGPRFLIIKKGENGALLFGDDQVFFAPALPLEDVFDPTGAGDSFAGGFTGYLAHSGDISFESMKSAIITGSAMASFCVEKFGTENLVRLDEGMINERIARFAELVRFDHKTV